MNRLQLIGLYLLLSAACFAGTTAFSAEPASGWRGNGTGLWPDAKPPLEWKRIPHGALEGMRHSAQRPAGAEPADAPPLVKGLPRQWLVVGPFPVADSVRDFDQDLLSGEAAAEPTAGDKIGEREWKSVEAPFDDIMVFGAAELPFVDLAKAVGFARNQMAYTHVYLHSPRGGPARIVVDHAHGLKAWLNGREVYRAPERKMQLAFYPSISKYELSHQIHPSRKIEVQLKAAWNRLLLKVSTSNREDYTDMRFTLRISDPPNVPYETQNVVWMTELPGRSTSTPIIVGDKLFVMAEPDELLCLDKQSGRILWKAALNYYEALTPEERKAKPGFAERVDPLVAELRTTTDCGARLKLRSRMQQILVDLDPQNFKLATDGHFESHFGIVGFTMPTPVSDGQHVFAWSGMGVAACYELSGKREWITRVDTGDLTYGSSPALADGVLVTFLNRLYGLDAKSGKVLWEQPKVSRNVAALLATTLGGETVVVTQRGDVVRPRDGKLLFRPQGSNESGDTGWSPPLILGQTVYRPKYGVTELTIFDFSDATAENFEPKIVSTVHLPPEVSLRENGGWIDRWTAGSPLVWQGISYQVDIYQTLYAVDLKTGKMLYRQNLELEGYTHYNAVAVAASPTLVGKHLYVMDNQGTTLVLEPGPQFKVVARNRIATQLDRWWPLPAQETLSYSPPVADGERIYVRGEAYLYCLGEK